MTPRAATMTVLQGKNGPIRIGCAHTPRRDHTQSIDAVRIQSALLDPRTERPVHPVRRLIAPLLRWL